MALIYIVAYVHKYIYEKDERLHQIYSIEELIVAAVLHPSPNDLP